MEIKLAFSKIEETIFSIQKKNKIKHELMISATAMPTVRHSGALVGKNLCRYAHSTCS